MLLAPVAARFLILSAGWSARASSLSSLPEAAHMVI